MSLRERLHDSVVKPTDRQLVQTLLDKGIKTVVSVPCSITNTMDSEWQRMAARGKMRLVKTSHEHNLVGIATGMYLGSGEVPLVHMQNSGFTNNADGLISWAKVYKLPVLELITWRGSDRTDDSEPHQEIGEMTEALTRIVVGSEAVYGPRLPRGRGILRSIDKAFQRVDEGRIGVIRLSPDAFKKELPLLLPPVKRLGIAAYRKAWQDIESAHGRPMEEVYNDRPISRAEAMQEIVRKHRHSAIVFANGYNSREAQSSADRLGNLYNAGYMGGSLAIGWGMAIANPDLEVVVVDGDQNALMSNMKDNLAAQYPGNLQWYILDNGVGASVGVSQTVNLGGYLPNSSYYQLARVIETVPDDPNVKFTSPRVSAQGKYFDRSATRRLAREIGPLPAHAEVFRLWVKAQTDINIKEAEVAREQTIREALTVYRS